MCKTLEMQLTDIAWQNKTLVQKRRMLDSYITALFLDENRALVETAVKKFVDAIKLPPAGLVDHYYLKGGNAISVLKGINMTGDYDFQLVPNEDVYRNWANRIGEVDRFVIGALEEAAGELSKYITDENNPDAPAVWVRENAFEPAGMTRVTGGEIPEKAGRITGIAEIGHDYDKKSQAEILRDPKYNRDTQRLELKNAANFTAGSEQMPKLYIYANYTIPGFLLYRLVISYAYKLQHNGKTETVPLKSEIIDVSVPRAGSAERYLSQEGVITHFRQKDGFVIPGWGYHFYENINLLQEINFQYSGSPHKREKRMQRLRESIVELKKSNGGRLEALSGEKMTEDAEDGPKEILAYAGAANYQAQKLADAEAAPGIFRTLYEDLMRKTEDHLRTVDAPMAVSDPVERLARLLVTFHSRRSQDNNIMTVKDVRQEVKRYFTAISEDKVYFASPLTDLPEEMPFNFGFVLVNIRQGDRSKLPSHVRAEITDHTGNSPIWIGGNCRGGAFDIIVHNVESNEKVKITLEQLLENSILLSQRLVLQEALKPSR